MSAPFRVALVGCGDIAEHGHAPALARHPRFRPVAVCDVRPERAALVSRSVGHVPACADYHELLDRPDIDAAVLALHPEVGVGVAVDFLQHGKPVLGEKPLARSLEDAERLVRTVDKTHGIYQIGFVLRTLGVVQRLAQLAPKIGTPAHYEVCHFDERLDRENREHFSRIQQIFRNSSAITHEGSHFVDFFRLWNPSGLTKVRARALKTVPDFQGPNLWDAQFDVADGSVLHVIVGWFFPTLARSWVRIAGPGGTAEVDLSTGQGEFRSPEGTERLSVGPFAQNWAAQLDAFADAIDRKRPPAATARDGVRALLATLACEESARTGRLVEIRPPAWA
jgi:predicted dehydrogenase